MSRNIPNLPTLCLVAATLLGPLAAQAGGGAAVSCSVAIDYLRNGTLVEQYRQDFVVEQGAPYVDDFSTPTRFKRFTADAVRQSGATLVTFDWFSDVGVFHAVGVGAQLALRGGGKEETVSGNQTFAASSGTSPSAVGGNHNTQYSLTCRRL